MIVMEGGTLLGIANDHFHTRLENLADEKGMNFLLSYLPSGISRWTCAERIFEERRLFVYDELTADEAFITVEDVRRKHDCLVLWTTTASLGGNFVTWQKTSAFATGIDCSAHPIRLKKIQK